MKLVVIGGHSRSVGKTSVAAALIAATRDLAWTAVKLTQHGHGICSASGEPCGCESSDPDCPYSISRETDPAGASDTARLLRAGAREVYWVRSAMGQLADTVPALEQLLKHCEHVLIESNSILEYWRADLYLPVLRFDIDDFKTSSKRFWTAADAYVTTACPVAQPRWAGVDTEALKKKPVFQVEPPGYGSAELTIFCRTRLQAAPVHRDREPKPPLPE